MGLFKKFKKIVTKAAPFVAAGAGVFAGGSALGVFGGAAKGASTLSKVGGVLNTASSVASIGLGAANFFAQRKAGETDEEYAERAQAIQDEARGRSDASLGRSAETLREAAGFSRLGTELQLMQADREIYQTLGGIRAQTAGSGLAASGSALDIIRSSAQQGELEKQIIGLRGQAEYASLIGQAQATELSAGITPKEDVEAAEELERRKNAPTPDDLKEMYPRLLGRPFNPVTDSYWLNSGDTKASAEANIAKVGSSAPNATLLQEMYSRVLGRDWNADTDSYWLKSGDTLASTERNVGAIASAAPTSSQLQETYSRLLNRDFNSATDSYWLKSGDTLASTERSIRRILQVSPGTRVQLA